MQQKNEEKTSSSMPTKDIYFICHPYHLKINKFSSFLSPPFHPLAFTPLAGSLSATIVPAIKNIKTRIVQTNDYDEIFFKGNELQLSWVGDIGPLRQERYNAQRVGFSPTILQWSDEWARRTRWAGARNFSLLFVIRQSILKLKYLQNQLIDWLC